MSRQRFIERDGFGRLREVWYDPDLKRMIYRTTTPDVEPVLRQNAADRDSDGFTADRTKRREASIPFDVFNQWCYARGVNALRLPPDEFRKFILSFINDPDWKHLRTCRSSIRASVPRLYAARRAVPPLVITG